MGLRKTLFSWNFKISDLFTRALGLATHAHFLHTNRPYFAGRTREAVRRAAELFPERPLRVLDIGCGRYSFLEAIKDVHPLIEPYGMDVSAAELKENSFVKNTIVFDSCRPDYAEALKEYREFFHVVISHDFLEHVPDPHLTHSLINFVLRPGAFAVHGHPALYEPLHTAAHLIPQGLARRILYRLEPARARSGKFRTFYRNCRAFSPRLEKWYALHGFSCIDHHNYYGTAYLYSVFPAQMALDIFYWAALKARLRIFASYSIISLQKQGQIQGVTS